jgi:CHAT domain-containing protein
LTFATLRVMSDCVASRRVVVSLLVSIGTFVPLVTSCRTERADAAIASRISSALFDDRFTFGRLDGQNQWRACVRGDTNANSKCSAPVRSSKVFAALAADARSARQRLDADSSIEALHDAALLALRLRDSVPNGLDEAARLLARARRVAPGNIVVLNDFAVVQLEIGERDQTIRPFLYALDAVQRSLVADSAYLPALFNRALILERLNLLSSAHDAWSRFAAVERTTAWRGEAHSHDSLLALPTDTSLYQGGRDRAFRLLAEWGRATVARDDAGAMATLDSIHRLVARVDSLYADRSVALMVAAVDSQVELASRPGHGRATLEQLAAAHAELGDGLTAYGRSAYDVATQLLDRSGRSLRALGSRAAGWAVFYQAVAEMNRGEYDTASRRLQALIDGALPQQFALVGKSVSTQGVIQVRKGNFELGNKYYRAAEPYLRRARERDNEGSIPYLLSESLNSAGQTAAGQAEVYRALHLLASYRRSYFLNNHLGTVAAYARTDSLWYAALAVMDEVLNVARAMGNPVALALAYRTKARDLVAVGQTDSARAALDHAMSAAEQLAGNVRDRTRADVQLVQGQIARTADPRAALPTLVGVANDYLRLGAVSKASAAAYEVAIAARDAGDSTTARQWLRDAIAQIERQQTTVESSEGRAALFETADNAFDAMIDLEMRAGHADEAFSYLERERAATRPPSIQLQPGTESDALSLDAIRRHLSDDGAFIEYAVLRDRTIVWVVSRKASTYHVIPVPRDTVAALVDQFLRETSIPEPSDADARSRLFDLLLRPLSTELAGAKQISVVTDRDLVRLPFAALWDRTARQYIVERYQVRTEPSATFMLATRPATPLRQQRRSALVIGDPVLDSTEFRLEPLPGAAREAKRVASLYRGALLLTGADARRDSVLALLSSRTVFHFAGHAVFNADRPELSYLALGTPREGQGIGALEARDISTLHLPNLELVVLSACRTLSSRNSRTGAVAGLAASFLRAGAPAILSTLWDVSDDVTESLLAGFHQRFAAGIPAADALRQAQLDALYPREGHRTAPAAWAAFIYSGP